MGGARNAGLALLPDDRLVDTVLGECMQLMGIKKLPEFTRVFRWERAIPQYNVGYMRIMQDLDSHLARLPGLYVRCNWVGGVSLNDCIANSMKVAGEICE